jgi:hypothetical protein
MGLLPSDTRELKNGAATIAKVGGRAKEASPARRRGLRVKNLSAAIELETYPKLTRNRHG